MSELITYFTRFLTDTVNLNKARLDLLDSRVESIAEALKGSAGLDGRVLDTVPQGSWAHKTIIRPAAGCEFDADILVQVSEDLDWNDDPCRYANAVWSALHDHGTYGSMSTKKSRCVCVTYANDCHIDVITYVILASGREVIVNRTTNEFEDTNPIGFTAWIQEKDDLTNGNLRKAIRLLKYLRDHQKAFNLKSVLLSTMVGNVVNQWRTYDTDYYKSVPTTLVHLVEDLDTWLQGQPMKPSITDPSCPSTTFDHRWTDAQFIAFKNKVHELAPKMRAAYDTTGTAESISAWQEVFGRAFPTAANAAASSAPVSNVAPTRTRAPGEQFIEDKFTVADTHTVKIMCEVSEPTYANRAERRQALRSRGGRVPKHRSLLFKVVDTNVPAPYEVRWKIRNTGGQAAALGKLRGEIVKDAGHHERQERTEYTGHHYVECYIIKDNVCVARAHEPVVIS